MRHLKTWQLLFGCVMLAALAGVWAAVAHGEPPPRLSALLQRLGLPFEHLPIEGSAPPVMTRPRVGGLDVTFLFTADTHFGWGVAEESTPGAPLDPTQDPQGIDEIHLKAIREMNAISTRRYPPRIGTVVGTPQGLLVAGDLTEHGTKEEWRRFAAYYGHDGRDGLVHLPVFEGTGNHDWSPSLLITEQVVARHGARYYGWDWGDLHLVCLGEASDGQTLDWLRNDLAQNGRDRPVVVYLHLSLAGPYSTGNWFAAGGYKDRLRSTLQGYNVIGIFHGHSHVTGTYRWHGYDVYTPGSAKAAWRSFLVVHVTDGRLVVAAWNYEKNAWWWWHSKPINGVTGGPPAQLQVERLPGLRHQPLIFDR